MSEQLEACLFYQLDRARAMRLYRLANTCNCSMRAAHKALARLRAKGMVQRIGWGLYSTRQLHLPGIPAP